METATEIEHSLPTGETATYRATLTLCAGHLCVAVEYPESTEVGQLAYTDAYPVAAIEDWASGVVGFRVEAGQCVSFGAGSRGLTEEVWVLEAGGALRLADLALQADVETAALCEAAVFDDDLESAIKAFRMLADLPAGVDG